ISSHPLNITTETFSSKNIIQTESNNIPKSLEETFQSKEGEIPKSLEDTIQSKEGEIPKSLEDAIPPRDGDIPKSLEDTIQSSEEDIPKFSGETIQPEECTISKFPPSQPIAGLGGSQFEDCLGKKVCKSPSQQKKSRVPPACHSSNNGKHKIGGSWSKPAWVKRETLCPK
uniref:Uncharacterized protein n=1 Tax=Castor canadensis TaxID=51338 RepID=A0A8C0VUJ5_CASCN